MRSAAVRFGAATEIWNLWLRTLRLFSIYALSGRNLDSKCGEQVNGPGFGSSNVLKVCTL